MSSRHAMFFPPQPVKPVRYRLHRTWWQRLQPFMVAVVIVGFVAVIVLGVATLIARLNATQAQLDAAYLAGLANGQTMCGGR